MNFADLENMWHSPRNRPDPAQLEQQKMQLLTDLRKRRRKNLWLIGLVFCVLAFMTGKIGLHLLRPNPALDKIDLAREWGIVPFFALPWIGWLVLVHLYRRNQVRHPEVERSINASVAALLDENRAERTRHKVIAGLLVVSTLMLPLIVTQLRSVGKVGDEIVIPAYVIFPLYVLGAVTWIWFQHHRRLLPRKRELEMLLKSYE